MKLVRFGPRGRERPGVLDAEGGIRDLGGIVDDFVGEGIGLAAIDRIRALDATRLPLVGGEVRLGPPVGRVGNFIAIGLNFADHAAETGARIPFEPILFNKAPSCLSGPNDDIVLPPEALKGDWEAELAVVMGRPAYRVSETEALDYVAGYAICNDVSERAWQGEGTGQWVKGKSAPTFGPLGPWLVTADEVPDPQALEIALDRNGKRQQTGSTRTMIFSVAELISFISRRFALETGDVITTGTPPGVGHGMRPQQFLKPGDTLRITITGLGEQNQRVIALAEESPEKDVVAR